MAVYNTRPNLLEAAIKSVREQFYEEWELCICDDCSTSQLTLNGLEQFRGCDPRLKITRAPERLHVARATNLAAEFATGAFISFPDTDELLTPDALELMAQAVLADPEADVLCSNADKLEENPRREPGLKTEVVRKSLFLAVGGLRHAVPGAHDDDLSRRTRLLARKVVHVPNGIEHWR